MDILMHVAPTSSLKNFLELASAGKGTSKELHQSPTPFVNVSAYLSCASGGPDDAQRP